MPDNDEEICRVPKCRQYGKLTKRFKRHLKKKHDQLTIKQHMLLPQADLSKLRHCPLYPCCSEDKRFKDLFKVIQERTRLGTEDVILHKLNQFYNGVYDK